MVNSVGQGRVLPARKNDSAADILGKLYNLLNHDYEDRKRDKEISGNFAEEHKMEEERCCDLACPLCVYWGNWLSPNFGRCFE